MNYESVLIDHAEACERFTQGLKTLVGHNDERMARTLYRWFQAVHREVTTLAQPLLPNGPGATRHPLARAYFAAMDAETAMRCEYYAFLKRNGPARERIAANGG